MTDNIGYVNASFDPNDEIEKELSHKINLLILEVSCFRNSSRLSIEEMVEELEIKNANILINLHGHLQNYYEELFNYRILRLCRTGK